MGNLSLSLQLLSLFSFATFSAFLFSLLKIYLWLLYYLNNIVNLTLEYIHFYKYGIKPFYIAYSTLAS